MARVAVAATTNGYHNDPKYSKGGSVRTDAGESRTMTTQVRSPPYDTAQWIAYTFQG